MKKRYLDESGEFLDGTIDIVYPPPKWEYAKFEERDFTDTLETKLLPSCMSLLTIEQNNVYVTIDFTALPSVMKVFNIARNRFTGSAVLDRLPSTLEYLHLYHNQFSGTLCLTKLPQALHNLSIMDNAFTGKLHLENTQKTISVYAGRKKFEPIAVIQKDSGLVYLADSGVENVFNEFGDVHKEMGQRVKKQNCKTVQIH